MEVTEGKSHMEQTKQFENDASGTSSGRELEYELMEKPKKNGGLEPEHENLNVNVVQRNTDGQDDDDDDDYNDDDDTDDFPEGGFRAWIVVLGCFFGLTTTFGMVNTMSVMETYIQSHQLAKVPSATIGWIFSLMLFLNFGTCIFSGSYFDRNGARSPLIVGSCVQFAGTVATANATKTWHFILAFSIVFGLGNGILVSPLVSAPAHYFRRRRGLATALASSGGSIGGIVYPILQRKCFAMESDSSEYYGFVWGMRYTSFLNLGLNILAILLVRERLPNVETDPEETRFGKFRRVFDTYVLKSFDVSSFKDLRYVFCVLGTMFGEISITGGLTYYGAYVIMRGYTNSDAYLLIMVINALGIPGRWLPGYFSDRYGRFNVAIVTLILLTIMILVLWLPFGKSLPCLYAISAMYGFTSGSIFSLLPVCCGQISKTSEFGRRWSTMYGMVSVGILAGVPITGAIIGPDKTPSGYDHYVIWVGMLTLVSAICFIISRYFAVGLKLVRF
ncbi:LAMI_0C09516g1_1 [Lachancea mirantina]|uniref:LAMI_0C09516g1_1 n=1 Tax=Lachancea mirantina TaxID=1230905 RepID=A0A1G4J5S5_9SACH|nr:LAMI_0C09516g1_1 [Lachancea mirantina]